MPPLLMPDRPRAWLAAAPQATRLHLLVAAIAMGLATLALQLGTFAAHPSNRADDFTAYISNARALATGAPYGMPGYILNRNYAQADSGQGAYPPGYPLVLAPVVALASDPVRAAGQFNCVLYAAFVGWLTVFSALRAGLAGGLTAGAVAGLSPMFIDQGAMRTPTESLSLLVLIAALSCDGLFRAGRRSGAGAVAALGVLIAGAGLIRVTAVLLGPASILADLVRRRRLGWPVLAASVLAGALFVAVMLGAAMDYVVQNVGVLRTETAPGAVGGPAQQMRVILGNLAAMPGNMTVLWTFLAPDSAQPGAVWTAARKAGTLVVLGLAAYGFAAQLRRRVTAAELFFVLQVGLLLNLTELLRSPRYWVPVSVLALVYAVTGAQAVGRWPRQRMSAVLAVAVLTLGPAVGGIRAALPDPYSLADPRAVEAFRHVATDTPPGSVIVGRRPRTTVFYAGRSAVDYHLPPSDPAFWPWARSVGATHLLLSLDQPDVMAMAGEGGSSDAASFDAFLGPEAAHVVSVFANGRYRLFQIVERSD